MYGVLAAQRYQLWAVAYFGDCSADKLVPEFGPTTALKPRSPKSRAIGTRRFLTIVPISQHALPLEKARALFEHVLRTYSYDSSGCTPAKGEALGDLQVACDIKRGTCTDLHGLLIAYLRAMGVPARFAFGFNIPARSEGRIAGYHCWSEAYLPGSGWYPIDVSEARKREEGPESDFFFGNLDENRVQFSTGRDLVLVPAQTTGPLDKFIFPLGENADEKITTDPEFYFRDLATG